MSSFLKICGCKIIPSENQLMQLHPQHPCQRGPWLIYSFFSVEQERALYKQMDAEENLDDLHFKYEKIFMETKYPPVRLDEKYYDGLNMTGTWQKF